MLGLLGPLLLHPEISFVKGAFHRPLAVGGDVLPGQGGRVTELVARPLLNLYAPHLAGFDQPSPARRRLAPSCSAACASRPATGWRSPT